LFKDVPGLTRFARAGATTIIAGYFKLTPAVWWRPHPHHPTLRTYAVLGGRHRPIEFSFGEISGDFGHFDRLCASHAARAGPRKRRHNPKILPRTRKLYADVRTTWRSSELRMFARPGSIHRPAIRGGVARHSEWIRRPYAMIWGGRVRRNMPFQSIESISRTRFRGLDCCTPRTGSAYATARGVAQSPCTPPRSAGALFEAFGGSGHWYAPPHRPDIIQYGVRTGRAQRAGHQASDGRHLRSILFAKFRLEGRDAPRVLNRVCAMMSPSHPDGSVYTQWLTSAAHRGGLTVTRLDEPDLLDRRRAETERRTSIG